VGDFGTEFCLAFFCFFQFCSADVAVRVAHAGPDTPNIDVYLNNTLTFSNLAFGKVTKYLVYPFGPVEVTIVPTGKIAPMLVNTQADLIDDNQAFTVTLQGFEQSMTATAHMDNSHLVPIGFTAVRVMNLVPDVPFLDIMVNDTMIAGGLPFGDSYGYANIPSGNVAFTVNMAGTTETVLMANTQLELGASMSLLIEGSVEANPLMAVWTVDLL